MIFIGFFPSEFSRFRLSVAFPPQLKRRASQGLAHTRGYLSVAPALFSRAVCALACGLLFDHSVKTSTRVYSDAGKRAKISLAGCSLWLIVVASFHTGIFQSFGAIHWAIHVGLQRPERELDKPSADTLPSYQVSRGKFEGGTGAMTDLWRQSTGLTTLTLSFVQLWSWLQGEFNHSS